MHVTIPSRQRRFYMMFINPFTCVIHQHIAEKYCSTIGQYCNSTSRKHYTALTLKLRWYRCFAQNISQVHCWASLLSKAPSFGAIEVLITHRMSSPQAMTNSWAQQHQKQAASLFSNPPRVGNCFFMGLRSFLFMFIYLYSVFGTYNENEINK